MSACKQDDYSMGAKIYASQCANCHMDSGQGLSALIPPLANADYLAKNREKLPCIVRYGLADTIQVNGKQYAERMAGVPHLTEAQIANLLNYIGHSWGNNLPPFSLPEVVEGLKKCPQ